MENLDNNITKYFVMSDDDNSMGVQFICNQFLVTLKRLQWINPMVLNAPWYDSCLKNCKGPPNVYHQTLTPKPLYSLH